MSDFTKAKEVVKRLRSHCAAAHSQAAMATESNPANTPGGFIRDARRYLSAAALDLDDLEAELKKSGAIADL